MERTPVCIGVPVRLLAMSSRMAALVHSLCVVYVRESGSNDEKFKWQRRVADASSRSGCPYSRTKPSLCEEPKRPRPVFARNAVTTQSSFSWLGIGSRRCAREDDSQKNSGLRIRLRAHCVNERTPICIGALVGFLTMWRTKRTPICIGALVGFLTMSSRLAALVHSLCVVYVRESGSNNEKLKSQRGMADASSRSGCPYSRTKPDKCEEPKRRAPSLRGTQ